MSQGKLEDVSTTDRTADRLKVHPVVRAAAEWSWRLVVIAVALYLAARVIARYEEVFVPIGLAVLGTAFLVPLVDWLNRRGVPRALAVVGSLVVAIGAVAGIMTFVVQQFIDGVPDLTDQVTKTIDDSRGWLIDGPLGIREEQIDHLGDDSIKFLQDNQDKVTSGALATATTVSEIVTGALLMLFLMIFFLYGGGQIWRFLTLAIPEGSREKVWEAGQNGFGSLVGYVRATVVVAAVDAIGIGAGLAILQVPLALPLASLVFIGAFIPIVGALITGSLAVLVALVTQGWIAAVIALAVVVGVMQLESHVLQPFLLGRSVRLHPVAVVLAIAAGLVTAGIVGGLLAVPIIAFLNTAIRTLVNKSKSIDGDSELAEVAAASGKEHERMYEAEPDRPKWDDLDAHGARGPKKTEKPDDDAAPDDKRGSSDDSS
ncbi:AI-2E family transporter [Williamsia soli]|uniref:AI-2E family transporter n=1 Tax=Williamsia soli TaxID=364929 RepID=UPI0027DB0731|nr:AI-2E family transporter [Williamsia soli]